MNWNFKLIVSFTHDVCVDEDDLKDFVKSKVYWYLMEQEKRQKN